MLRLCLEFLKIGLFSVGGGLATLPFLKELGERTAWFTPMELADMVAVSESTPGPIGINMATYVGYNTFGIPGAILASFSLVLPSFIIMIMIAKVLQAFQESMVVKNVFTMLRPTTGGLILAALQSLSLMTLFNLPLFRETGMAIHFFRPIPLGIFLLFYLGMIRFPKIHPLVYILMGGILGVVLKL